MAPSDSESMLPDPHGRKPYVAPKVIFSELYARGVNKDTVHVGTAEYHSPTTESSS